MELKIIHKKIKELKPADWNPRGITDSAMEGLKNSLKEYGMPQPVIFNKQTGNIVGGHQRTKAAAALGWETVPCVEVDLSLIQEKALNVTLNNQRIAGHFTDKLTTILDDIRIELGDDFFRDIKLDEIIIPNFDSIEKKEKVGAKEYGAGEFSEFDHKCPKCGFEFDEQS